MLVAHDEAIRSTLLDRLCDARQRSDSLFDIVQPGALYDRPIPERHRIIFYLGHLEAFDWNLLRDVFDLRSFHPEFDHLFAFGIDPVGGGLPTDQPADWPPVQAIREYVSRLRTMLDERLRDEVPAVAETSAGFSLETLLNVAIEHRLMHVETLAYMLHQLPIDSKVRQPRLPHPLTAPLKYESVEIPAGEVTLGLARNSDVFGWDNEFEAHTEHVPLFEMDRFQVTNGNYLEFLNSGGYEDQGLWNEIDWKWRTEQNISHPAFWKKNGEHWLYRTMFEEMPLPPDWPVYVSHAEATAYARWAGKALPTEAEWHRAAYGNPNDIERPYPWGIEGPNPSFGNFDFERWSPVPVNAYQKARSAFGVHQMVGNGWEWTSTVFSPFPGFEPFPFYRGYSADFFDGKHFVMKGGSPRTAACMLRSTFRNWFQPHYQYVYSGFRCVRR
jgi:ergothioneine biosynthesis protein EgtB